MSEPPMPPGPPGKPLPQPEGPPLPQEPRQEYQQRGPVPVQHPPEKPKRFGWAALIIAAIAGLSLGGIVGGIVGGSADVTAATAGPTATATATSNASTAKKTTKPEPASTIGEGISEIGVDVMPGQYKTQVPADSECDWERWGDQGDGFDSILDGSVNAGQSASVTVERGEFFISDDCGTWTRL